MVGGSFRASASLLVQAASSTRVAPQPPTPDLGPVFRAAHGGPQGRVAGMGPVGWGRVFCLGFGSLETRGPARSGAALMRPHGLGPGRNITFAECDPKQILDPPSLQTLRRRSSSPSAPPPFGLITKHLFPYSHPD